jgi:hypothetical protein
MCLQRLSIIINLSSLLLSHNKNHFLVAPTLNADQEDLEAPVEAVGQSAAAEIEMNETAGLVPYKNLIALMRMVLKKVPSHEI